VNRELLPELARCKPLLPGKGTLAFIDIDSMQKRVYGHAKQGAASGHTKNQGKSLRVRGLNALAATISTPLAAPVIAATRLRGGNASSARGAASFATEAIHAARAAGYTGTLVVRADSAFYSAAFTGAVRQAGAFFSVTVRMNSHVRVVIVGASDDAWTPIRYPGPSGMTSSAGWVSDGQVAEVPYTAFTSKKGRAITTRLIVRRVKDLNRKSGEGQDELFPLWRYYAVFTPFVMLQAEGDHRDHAVVEQAFADWSGGPLAHLPSGSFPANAAWLALAAIAHNLLRAAGTLASLACAKARGATPAATIKITSVGSGQ
jgi:Transposase DDE domain group 1